MKLEPRVRGGQWEVEGEDRKNGDCVFVSTLRNGTSLIDCMSSSTVCASEGRTSYFAGSFKG